MKKIIAVLAALVVLTLVGCASSGGSSGGRAAGDASPYSVDLNTLRAVKLGPQDAVGEPTGERVKNKDAFTKNYDDLFILFPSNMQDVTGYSRVTIKCKYFGADGAEIAQNDGNAMVVLVYDINGDKRGPEMGAGPNTPLKEFNVGGFSGQVSSDRGVRVALSKNPGAILFQNSNVNVKFIEVTEITFHN